MRPLTSTPLDSILARLEQTTGLDRHALEPERLSWILRNRCRTLALDDLPAYERHLDQSAEELDTLIDAVVVQETRFFRDPTVFLHIRNWLARLAAASSSPIRLLSAPCGTGQEAYSLAALLRLLGVPASRFTIDAVDISLGALAAARLASYPERSVTHLAPDLQTATGSLQGHHWVIHPELRDRVCFHRRNLAEPGALATSLQTAPYDLILCRNLFIYLAPSARTILARSLADALAPSGRLILGTADRVEELSALFQPVTPAASFAFQHRAATARARPIEEAATQTPTSAAMHPRSPFSLSPEQTTPASSTPAGLLALAQQHFRRGELARAERRCRQALYLAPNLLPALELLDRLWDRNPNPRHRRALRDRILRHEALRAASLQEPA